MRDLEGLRVRQAAAFVRARGSLAPQVGVVLGSGLGAFADDLAELEKIPYAHIPCMPRSNVAGHAGNLCLGRSSGVAVACLQGRVHAYEGHAASRVVFGVRVLAELGCRVVLLTNAAGGIGADLTPGSLMLICDHINLMGVNPLVAFGEHPEFIDMTRAYDPTLCEAARSAAREAGIALKEGVYAGMLGPSYETPAEIAMLRQLGAAAVGMSTVPEVIALRQCNVRVGAVSCITNLAAGISGRPLEHREVQETAAQASLAFARLLSGWIVRAREAA